MREVVYGSHMRTSKERFADTLDLAVRAYRRELLLAAWMLAGCASALAITVLTGGLR